MESFTQNQLQHSNEKDSDLSNPSTISNDSKIFRKDYYTEVINLKPKNSYDLIGSKKFKINSELAYSYVQNSQYPLFKILSNNNNHKQQEQMNFQLQSQVIQSKQKNVINNKNEWKQKVKISKKKCSYRKFHSCNSFSYDNLQKLLLQNPSEISTLQLSQESLDLYTLFMKKYDPKPLLINDIPSIITKQKQLPVKIDYSPKISQLSFRDSININFKDMNEENMMKIKKSLKNIFYLYLNGDYRGINESVISNGGDTDQWDDQFNNRYVSYKYKSKHINFDFKQPKNNSENSHLYSDIFEYLQKKEEEEEEDEDQNQEEEDQEERDNLEMMNQSQNTQDNEKQTKVKNKKKQVIYNKSKYVMQFILKLLDEDHLDLLTIPQGFITKILNIQQNIRSIGKKNKLSQSQFYNHSHFDCLFLQINTNTDQYLYNNQELQKMHCKIFEVTDLNDNFTFSTVNFYKELITQIILTQVNLIRTAIIPQLAAHTLSFKSSSKLKYFERICDSIEKLNDGLIINKF